MKSGPHPPAMSLCHYKISLSYKGLTAGLTFPPHRLVAVGSASSLLASRSANLGVSSVSSKVATPSIQHYHGEVDISAMRAFPILRTILVGRSNP